MSHNFKLMNFYKKYWYIFWFIIYGLLFAISVLFVNILSVSKLFIQLIIIGVIIGILSKVIHRWIHKKVININFNFFIWILLYVILLFVFEFVLSYIKTAFIWEIIIIGTSYTLIIYLLKKIKFKTLSIIAIIFGLVLLMTVLYQGDDALNNKQAYSSTFTNINLSTNLNNFAIPVKYYSLDVESEFGDTKNTEIKTAEIMQKYIGEKIYGFLFIKSITKQGGGYFVVGYSAYPEIGQPRTIEYRVYFPSSPQEQLTKYNAWQRLVFEGQLTDIQTTRFDKKTLYDLRDELINEGIPSDDVYIVKNAKIITMDEYRINYLDYIYNLARTNNDTSICDGKIRRFYIRTDPMRMTYYAGPINANDDTRFLDSEVQKCLDNLKQPSKPLCVGLDIWPPMTGCSFDDFDCVSNKVIERNPINPMSYGIQDGMTYQLKNIIKENNANCVFKDGFYFCGVFRVAIDYFTSSENEMPVYSSSLTNYSEIKYDNNFNYVETICYEDNFKSKVIGISNNSELYNPQYTCSIAKKLNSDKRCNKLLYSDDVQKCKDCFNS